MAVLSDAFLFLCPVFLCQDVRSTCSLLLSLTVTAQLPYDELETNGAFELVFFFNYKLIRRLCL